MAKKEELPERIKEVSPDLAYELQSRFFDQLATVSLGGAGLTITLAGSLLQGSPLVWISAVEFGVAALMALTAQRNLIGHLYDQKPVRKRSRMMTTLCMLLIGMGVGSLGGAVYLQAEDVAAAAVLSTE
ncbi:MAG: hypothetical protein NT015_13810 [Alphaproteobacteria bacterium]|nr:hypothetical protein [Alphaproteobacteria bacterium]